MAIDPRNALLFVGGAVVAVAAVAYGVGAFDPVHILKQTEVAAPPGPAASTMGKNGRLAAKTPDSGAEAGHAATGPAAEETPQAKAAPSNSPSAQTAKPGQPAQAKVVTPSFDVVRVEGNGSVVVAGKAGPNAMVELLSGSHVIGTAKAGPEGDFAIVLDKPLKPGNYQLVLRATAPDKLVAMSKQTAVVSVPEHSDGQVLALVETPGEPSKLITVPEPPPVKSGGGPTAVAKGAAKAPVAAEASPGTSSSSALSTPSGASSAPGQSDELASISPQQEMAKHAQSGTVAKRPKVAVDAVEIEGSKIFIAGSAEPGKVVRIYANDVFLGEAAASKLGRFLVEAMRELAVGDYIIRADMVDPEGRKVIARAAVPFQRQAGEAVAAVAPQADVGAKADAGGSAHSSASAASPAPGQLKLPPLDNPIAKGPPTVLGAKLEEADGAVIIRRHDTLWQISRRVYGRGVRYSTIYLANQDEIQDPDLIYPGQVFRVPDKTKEGVAADMSAIGDQATTMGAKPAAQ